LSRTRDSARDELDLAALERRQAKSLALDARTPITRPAEAERFLSGVGMALRYGPTSGLPIASLYQAFAGPRPAKNALTGAIGLTNGLLGRARAIEVHVVADRVTLVHRSVMPALYALVRRGRELEDLRGLSVNARTAVSLLRETKEATAGDVRRRLGLAADPRHDPAYAALAELEHLLLVDRGPFEIPKAGIPYLSKEGYPYHFFHEAHPELAAAAARLTIDAAAATFLMAYLTGAVFARGRKLASMFKAFLSPAEIDEALRRLAKQGKVDLFEGGVVVRAA